MANLANCIAFNLDHSEQAEAMRSWFPGESDGYIGDILTLWRKHKFKDLSDYPSTKEEIVDFISGDLPFSAAGLDTREKVVEAYDMLHKTIGTHIGERVDMIADDFGVYMKRLASKNGISVNELKSDKKKLGEVLVFMLGQYKRLSNPENAIDYVNDHGGKDWSDEIKRKQAEHVAIEFVKIRRNFDLLFDKARYKIEDMYGIKFKTDASKVLEQLDEEVDWDKEDTGVVERYKDDRRKEHTIKTLSSYAKDAISNIPLRDANGSVVRDDMMRVKKLDVGTAYNVLAMVGQDATADTFVDKMKSNDVFANILQPILGRMLYTSEEAAAVNSGNVSPELRKKLIVKDKMRTSLITNFLKAKAIYVNIYSEKRDENGNYDKNGEFKNIVSNLNDAGGSERNSISNHIRMHLLSGIINPMYRQFSIINDNAIIGRPSELSGTVEEDRAYFMDIVKSIDELKKDFNKNVRDAKQADDNRYYNERIRFFNEAREIGLKTEKERYAYVEKAEAEGRLIKQSPFGDFVSRWVSDSPERIEKIKNWLGGIGVNADSDSVKNVISSRNTRFSKKKDNRTDIEPLLNALLDIYEAAADSVGHNVSSDTFVTGSLYEFTKKGQNPRKRINVIGSILGNSLGRDSERRVLNNGSSYAVDVLKDKMHDVVNKLKSIFNPNDPHSIDEMYDYEGYRNANTRDVFGNYTGGYHGWIANGVKDREIVDFTDFKKVEYSDMSQRQRFVTDYTLMFETKGYGKPLISCPQSADRSTMRYISTGSIFDSGKGLIYDEMTGKANVKDNVILDEYYQEVLMEIDRIRKARIRHASETKEQEKINRNRQGAYWKNDMKFFLFPEFNVFSNGMNVFDEYTNLLVENPSEAKEWLIDRIARALNERVDEMFGIVSKKNFNLFALKDFRGWVKPIGEGYSIDKDGRYYTVGQDGENDYSASDRFEKGDFSNAELTYDGRLKLQNFVVNWIYGRLQIAKMIGNNPVFYKSNYDQVKRQSGNQAPGVSIDYTARYGGVKVFDSTDDKVIYLSDKIGKAAAYENISNSLDSLVGNGMSEQLRDIFVKQYEEIVQTDGQGWRTLDSMRAIRIAMGGDNWTEEHEAAYTRIQHRHKLPGESKYLKDDIRILTAFQHLKPVVTGFEDMILEDGTKVKREVYHKYAEAVLLPSDYYDVLQNKSSYLRGLALAAERTGANAFVYTSCSKVNPTEIVCDPGAVTKDENGNDKYVFSTAEDIANAISGYVSGRPQAIHKIPYEYYRITAHTPVHSTDTKRAWSSQAIKAALNDAGDEKIVLGTGDSAKEFKGKDMKHLMSNIEAATVIENYIELRDMFDDPKKIARLLQEELSSKDYNSPEIQMMVKVLDGGEFAVPVFNAVTNNLSQQLFGSIIRKRLTRAMTKGGSAIQESAVGLDYDGVKYDDELKDFDDNDKLRVVFENGKLKHVEAYVPLFDTKLGDALVKGGYANSNGVIDSAGLNRAVGAGVIDEDLLDFIGYRTPSDGPHSVIPMHIKGFMVGSKGASIILPRESEVMMGHDFDADKLLFHLKQYSVDITKTVLGKGSLPKKFRTVRYDYNSSPVGQSQAARDNAMIEIVFNTLTSREGSARMFIPGGFELAKRAAKIIEYMTLTRNVADAEKVNSKDDFDRYMNMDSGRLDEMCERYRAKESIYDLSFALKTAYEIMQGHELIDRFALYNAAIMQLQDSGIRMDKSAVNKNGEPYIQSVKLFGHEIDELFGKYDIEGNYSSLVFAQLLNAMVDNAKDPLAGKMNITKKTVDMIAFLAASGYSINEIFLIMNNPVILRASQLADENDWDMAKAIKKVDEDIRGRYQYEDGLGGKVGHDFGGYTKLSKRIGDQMHDWYISQVGRDYESVANGYQDDIENSLGLLGVMGKIAKVSSTGFNELIQNIRPEASSASFKQTLGMQTESVRKLDDFFGSANESGLIIPDRVMTMVAPIEIGDADTAEQIFEKIGGNAMLSEKSYSTYVTALNNLMQRSAFDFLKRFYPQARGSWRDAINDVFDTSYPGVKRHGDKSLFDSIFREMIMYKMLQDGQFVEDIDKSREYYLNEVPKSLRKMLSRIAEIQNTSDKQKKEKFSREEIRLASNSFLDKLFVIYPESADDVPHISFNMQGTVDASIIENIRNAWGEMLDSKDENVRKMATDLYLYGFYHNGFGFGVNTFSQLAPLSVMMAAKEYVPAMDRVLKTDFSAEDVTRFSLQYKLNHWNDFRVAHRWSNKNLSYFLDASENVGDDTLNVKKEISESTSDAFGNITEYTDKARVLPGTAVLAFDKNNKSTLYYVTDPGKESDTYTFVKVPKLGYTNRHEQSTYTYNPNQDGFDMKRYSVGDDQYWGKLNTADSSSNISGADEWYKGQNPFGGQVVKKVSSVYGTGNSSNAELNDRINKSFDKRNGVTVAKEASDEGDTKYYDENGNEVKLGFDPSIEFAGLGGGGVFGARSDEALFSIDTHIDNMYKADEMNGRDIASDDGGLKSIAIAAEYQDENEHTTFIGKTLPSFSAIYEARQQRAAVELQKWIERTLASKGVAIGELRNAQANIHGKFTHKTPETTAEGLIEYILISNDEKGKAALPEEFSHFALACLGRNHQLVVRLLNSLRHNHDALVDAFGGQEAFDRYSSEYSDNFEKLVWEGAGKLVARHLQEGMEIKVDNPVGGILRRVINAIKNFFRSFKADDVRNAIQNADRAAGMIASGLLDGEIVDHLNLDNISDSMNFKASVKDLTSKNGYIDNILKREMARIKMYKRRIEYLKGKDASAASVGAAENILANLRINLQRGKIDKAILDYLSDTQDFLSKTEEKVKAYAKTSKTNSFCKQLNTVRDTIIGFSKSMDDIESYLSSEEGEGIEATMRQSILESFRNVKNIVDEFNDYYNKLSQMYFEKSLQEYFGDEVVIPIGKNKRKKISIKELATYAPNDINFMGRWFNSLADASDVAVKMFDFKVKKARFDARQDTIEMQSSIHNAVNELREATGSYDTSFIYQMKDGKQTGKYKSEVAMISEFGKDSPQYRYWKFFMDTKKKIDEMLPGGLVYSNDSTIKVMKGTLDKVRRELSNGDRKGARKDIWNAYAEQLLDMSDDMNYEVDEVVKDFEGNRIDLLPVRYLKLSRHASQDDVSLDSATALLLYGDMAHNFKHMDDVIGELENARYRAQEREVQVRNGSKKMVETVYDNYGMAKSPLTKKQANTYIGEALDDFFDMHVYGHLEKAEGTIGNTRISKRKLANKLNQATTFAQMGLNLSQRISNISTGSAQIMIEAIGNNFFGWKDLAYARKTYALEAPKSLSQIGADEKTSKLTLFNDKFDVQQENKSSFYEHEFKGSVSKKLFSSNSLYALLKIGEHYLSTTTSLALANRVKLKQVVTENGKTVEKDINLYDAYEVVYDNPDTKSGARLKLKEGVVKQDGKAWTLEDERAFSMKSAGVNFKLQGIYNQNDKAPVQARTLGSLLILYRKWLAPSIMRRYGKTSFNDLTGEWEEGYYRTTLNLVGNVLKDWDHFGTSVVVNWGKLDAYEKANVRKAMTEFAMLAGVYLAIALLHGINVDDDDDNVRELSWAQRMGLYQLLRLKNEIGTMTPTPMAVNEGLKILSSPAASLNTINRAIKLGNALMPWNWIGEQAEIKSGRYKGMTKTEKAFLEAPFVAIWRNIDKFVNPDDMIQYFENDTMY